MTPLQKRTRTFGKIGYTRLKLLSKPVIALPLVTFIVFVTASIVASSLAQATLEATRTRVIERRIQEDSLKFSNRLSSYELIASGGAGLISSGTSSPESWKMFINSYDVATNFPAVNAISYAQVMNRDDAQNFIDERNAANGNTNLSLSADNNGSFLLVKYVEPDLPVFMNRLGIDEYSFPARKQTIDQAVVHNKPMLTSRTELIRSNDVPNGTPQPGFIMFAPIYDRSKPLDTADQRRAALIGTSNVSFVASKFFDRIYADSERQTRSYLTISQGKDADANVIYEGGVRPAANDEIRFSHVITYENQSFTYDYSFSNSDLLTAFERDRPVTLLVAGILVGALLSASMLFAIRSRLHRLSSDKEREIQGAKDELLSLASHQLRTPATGVKQYMGMVLQGFAGDITAQQKEFLQKAYDSNERQLHIINDILHLAKLDAGRIVLTKTTFDMSDLVQSVLDEQADSANDAEVTLKRTLPKKLSVYADAHMMRMVVENLISNAIKYTHPNGEITATLKTVKDRYELSVRDTGVGIADADMDKLFKQFSRVANDRSHLVSGTGVGLYLVKNLVELHGGTVSVMSKHGRGTTFKISFPVES